MSRALSLVTSWYSIHGPAARMYGSYGHLYVTSPTTESIDSYDPLTGAWTRLGKPQRGSSSKLAAHAMM